MISFEQGFDRVMSMVKKLSPVELGLSDAWGSFLLEEVHAPFPHPLFDMSAVDGYAVGGPQGPWRILGEVAAGDTYLRSLSEGEALRIFTGGMVPQECFAVVMQEHAHVEGEALAVTAPVVGGSHIRRKGEQVTQGECLMQAGERLDAAAIGLLASCGIERVKVTERPRVRIIRTGGEFMSNDEQIPGRIPSSNEHMLQAVLAAAGCKVLLPHELVVDERDALAQAFSRAVQDADLVISTGGVSIGDHDLVRPVLEELGAQVHVHGIAQKPGKPMLFATLNDRPVFGLPGNPRAVLILAWIYVLPFTKGMMGSETTRHNVHHLKLEEQVSLKGQRTEFRAARVADGKLSLLRDEGSHMLRSLIHANALVRFPEDKRHYAVGDPVEVHYLPC
ncbi:MAG: molybdopterin molybdotransferase MoeA [Flavobacteriales bacterium]|nr:molybdopterin molybdotransferase MoeA [Flavobacteriales bacterium]